MVHRKPAKRAPRLRGLLLAVPLLLGTWLAAPAAGVARGDVADAPVAGYVGSRACADCHADQYRLWQGSHHDQAMQHATEETVLGDFDGARFDYHGEVSTFYRRDGKFFVRTDGPDGQLRDYQVRFTFGVSPLQQYLVELPGGRLQALPFAWDSRRAEEGGQRWFHLYQAQQIRAGDALHWTGPNQNWNYMCAGCHSTNLQKNYDPVGNHYDTQWSELDVACEACHGPGSQHLEWAAREAGERSAGDKGLETVLDEREAVRWRIDAATGNAIRNRLRRTQVEIDTCGRCHARASLLATDNPSAQTLLDTHQVSLLEPALYHADGQVKGEVFEYGSFLQSRMYRQGVTCSDCHEPHSLELRAPGDGVCLQCHAADKYQTRDHHLHPADAEGARCTSCHMPASTFMTIDVRRDHSFRVPRPDLSVRLDIPNACNGCHDDKTPQWAVEVMEAHYGHGFAARPSFAAALQAGRRRAPGAAAQLAALVRDISQPAIARATAVSLLPEQGEPVPGAVLATALRDASPLVRRAAADALQVVAPHQRPRLAGHLLQDPVRAVRTAVALALSAVPIEGLTGVQKQHLQAALAEYIDAQTLNAERPEARANLGLVYLRMGRLAEAERAYRAAIELQDDYLPAYVNLADVYRRQGREDRAEAVLRAALKIAPDNADAHFALGLTLVRRQQTGQAVGHLRRATGLRPEAPRYAYVYAVALHSTGRAEEALRVLQHALISHPTDRDLLLMLIAVHRERGALDQALDYAKRLSTAHPHDRAAQAWLRRLQLEAMRR